MIYIYDREGSVSTWPCTAAEQIDKANWLVATINPDLDKYEGILVIGDDVKRAPSLESFIDGTATHTALWAWIDPEGDLVDRHGPEVIIDTFADALTNIDQFRAMLD